MPVVTFLHGAGLNAHTWDTTVLGLGLPALAIDLPGHGDSSWRSDAAYVARVLAPDVAVGMDAWTDGPQLLVGQSLGGLTAAAVAGFVLMRRPYGRMLIAVGDNPSAAALAGSRVWWVRTRAFMMSSLSATVAGILLVGYAGVHPSVGRGYEFTAITAVVLGGVVLGGGRGWVLSAAAGAFALESLFTLLNFMGLQATWRDTVQGAIIIIAVAAASRSWQRKRKGASSAAHD